MSNKPPYINTFRVVTGMISPSGVMSSTINIAFDVDEILFKGVILEFPSTTATMTSVITCPELTTGEWDAPIGYAQYTGLTDTAYTSGSTIISYVYQTPRCINGLYNIRCSSSLSYTGFLAVIVEFRKYN